MNQQKFKIGQIIYVLSNKSQTIVPAMIIEEHTTQTLQGTSMSWKVAIGSGDKQRVVDSNKINGEIYSSLDEIKNLLTKKLLNYVEEVINLAKKKEKAWYEPLQKQNKIQQVVAPSKPAMFDIESIVDGVDDVTDNVIQMPTGIDFTKFSEDEKKTLLQQKLKNSILPSKEELSSNLDNLEDDISEPGKIMIDGPNGQKIIANIKV